MKEGKNVEPFKKLSYVLGGLIIVISCGFVYSCFSFTSYRDRDRARIEQLQAESDSLRIAYNEAVKSSESIRDALQRAEIDNGKLRVSISEATRRIEQLQLINTELGKRLKELNGLFGQLTEGDRRAEELVATIRREAEEAQRIIRELQEGSTGTNK